MTLNLVATILILAIVIAIPLAILFNWMKHRQQWNRVIRATEEPTKRPMKFDKDMATPTDSKVSALTRKPERKPMAKQKGYI